MAGAWPNLAAQRLCGQELDIELLTAELKKVARKHQLAEWRSKQKQGGSKMSTFEPVVSPPRLASPRREDSLEG